MRNSPAALLALSLVLSGAAAPSAASDYLPEAVEGLLGRVKEAAARLGGRRSGRTIRFSGMEWRVKSSAHEVGPGPNLFSDDPKNVWVDDRGRLHLRITRDKGRWLCAEVVASASLGHGSYWFGIDGPLDGLDANAVLGLFTWSDETDHHNREIDIEISRWGEPRGPNAQYVVQGVPMRRERFALPKGLARSLHGFVWRPGSVAFESFRADWSAAQPLFQRWTAPGAAPPAGGENPRINLWLYRGMPPAGGQEIEVVVDRFEFLAAP